MSVEKESQVMNSVQREMLVIDDRHATDFPLNVALQVSAFKGDLRSKVR